MKKKLKSIKANLRDHLFSKVWNLEVVWQLTREDYIKKKKPTDFNQNFRPCNQAE